MPPLNWKLTLLRAASKLTGIPPTYGMPLFSSVVMPVPHTSMPPTTASDVVGHHLLRAACERSGLNWVLQATSSIGWPSTPSSSVLMKSIAVRSALVSSGNAPAAPVSWLIVPIRIGRPVASVGAAGISGESIDPCGAHATIDAAFRQASSPGLVVVVDPLPAFEPVGSLHAPTATSATTTSAMRPT